MGTELVDWLMQQSSWVHSRIQAVGVWQVLLEEGALNHGKTHFHQPGRAQVSQEQEFNQLSPAVCCNSVDGEMSFQDKYLFYRFLDDEQQDAPGLHDEDRRASQEELQDALLFLSQIGPDALMRMILRKPYGFKATNV